MKAKPNRPTGLFHSNDNMESEEDKWRFWFGDSWKEEKKDWEKNHQAEWDRKTKATLDTLR